MSYLIGYGDPSYQICEALGIKPDHIKRIEIVLESAEIIHANITRLIDSEEVEQIRLILTQCEKWRP